MRIEYAFRIIYVSVVLLSSTRELVGGVSGSSALSELPVTRDGECTGQVGEILHQIRALMNDTKILNSNAIQAYIVPMNDAHQSEYVADHDKRLQYITKFTGSAGEAVITGKHAVLWTDSRYHIQAEEELDLNCWTLMKTGLPNVSSMPQWILSNFPSNSSIGVDPLLITDKEFGEIEQELKSNDTKLIGISQNLIDLVWKNRPEKKSNAVFPLEIRYSGKEAGLKLAEILSEAKEDAADTVIITALDEIAWILNLRGSDIQYCPVFFSYVILTTEKSYIFIDSNKITKEARKQLTDEKVNLIVRDYDQFLDGVKEIMNSSQSKAVVSTSVSRAITELISEDKRATKDIVAKMKTVKNRIEAENMINAHVRDGLAVIQYLHWLNTTIDVDNVTEVSGAEKLAYLRSKQKNFVGLSFDSISAVGGHASIVHYKPTEETSAQITRNEIYLIDSGGQYRDGTTDITRTYHFGTPKEEEKMCYTRVLKGFISLAMSIAPINTTLNYFDFIARRSLWQAGLNYGHGTGHGVGMYLLVHEYPPFIEGKATEMIRENMFFTDEPGYYKKNEFGIRIEDVLQVVKSDIPNAFDGNGALTFKSITCAPLPTNLIVTNMLTKEEANFVNSYNKRVMDTIGPILLKGKLMDTYKWLQQETRQICSWS